MAGRRDCWFTRRFCDSLIFAHFMPSPAISRRRRHFILSLSARPCVYTRAWSRIKRSENDLINQNHLVGISLNLELRCSWGQGWTILDFEVDRSRSHQGQISTLGGHFLGYGRTLVKHDYSLRGPNDTDEISKVTSSKINWADSQACRLTVCRQRRFSS